MTFLPRDIVPDEVKVEDSNVLGTWKDKTFVGKVVVSILTVLCIWNGSKFISSKKTIIAKSILKYISEPTSKGNQSTILASNLVLPNIVKSEVECHVGHVTVELN